nr:hypothetical protein [uncultured Hyphomonas sp.]
MRHILWVINAILFAGAAAPTALACSCGPCDLDTSFVEDPEIDSVFVGELLSVTKPDIGDDAPYWEETDVEYRFKVVQSLKGSAVEYIEIRTPESETACGAQFSFYAPNSIAAYKSETGTLRTSACTQQCWSTRANRSLLDEDTYQTLYLGIRIKEEN